MTVSGFVVAFADLAAAINVLIRNERIGICQAHIERSVGKNRCK